MKVVDEESKEWKVDGVDMIEDPPHSSKYYPKDIPNPPEAHGPGSSLSDQTVKG